MNLKIKENSGVWGLFVDENNTKDCHKIQWAEKGFMSHCTSKCMAFDLVKVDKVEQSATVQINCFSRVINIDCDIIETPPVKDEDYSLNKPLNPKV